MNRKIERVACVGCGLIGQGWATLFAAAGYAVTMQDLTDDLCEKVQQGKIDPKDAYQYAPNKEELKMALKGIRTVSDGIL